MNTAHQFLKSTISSIIFVLLSFFYGLGQIVVTPINGNITNSDNGVIYGWAFESNRYSLYQHIFKQPLINQNGTITHIQFKNQMSATFPNVSIYMGETTKNSFTSGTDWVNSGLTLVYTGNLSIANGWYEIALTTPFLYTNTNNLILVVHQNGGPTPNSPNARHVVGTHDANVSISNHGTSTFNNYPNWNGGFGSRSNELPNLKLTFASSCAAQIISTTPAERCGPGDVNIQASVSSGAIPRWFDQQFSGTQLGTGASFTTPSLTQTTTFWVEAYHTVDNCSSSRVAVVATVNDIPLQPSPINCWDIITLNTTTCQWEVTGTQPPQPILACYETATFNNSTCQWEVSGVQPPQPILACYETASFDLTTCQWNVSGTQPPPPAIECYESVEFNNTTCAWNIVTVLTNEITQSNNTLTAVQPGVSYQWIDCLTNLPVSANAIEQSYTPIISGSYAVQITDQSTNCTLLSDCVSITLLSTDLFFQEDFQLYPNPARESVRILGTQPGDIVSVISPTGQMFFVASITSLSQEIQLNHLLPAFYFVKISRADNEVVLKLIVH